MIETGGPQVLCAANHIRPPALPSSVWYIVLRMCVCVCVCAPPASGSGLGAVVASCMPVKPREKLRRAPAIPAVFGLCTSSLDGYPSVHASGSCPPSCVDVAPRSSSPVQVRPATIVCGRRGDLVSGRVCLALARKRDRSTLRDLGRARSGPPLAAAAAAAARRACCVPETNSETWKTFRGTLPCSATLRRVDQKVEQTTPLAHQPPPSSAPGPSAVVFGWQG